MSARFDVPEAFWRYAARLAGCQRWPPAPAEYARFLAACDRHRLLPLAPLCTTFPASVLPAAQEAAARNAPRDSARHAAQEQTLARLLPALQPGSWIAIKGLDYGRRLYPDPACRPMNDIDLLLRAEDFDTQVQRLLTQDFALRSESGPLERSLEDRRNGVVVDLYRSLIQPQRVAIDYDGLWAHALQLDDGTRVPAPPHALVLHALTMANLQFVTHLRKYLDLWLLLRDEAAALEAADWAARWRMRRAYAASLAMLVRIVPGFDSQPAAAAAFATLRRGERRWLQLAVLPSSPVPRLPPRPLALWRKLQLIDRWSQRLRFGLAHFAAKTA